MTEQMDLTKLEEVLQSPEEINGVISKLLAVQSEIDRLEKKKTILLESLKMQMKLAATKEITSDAYTISVKDAYTSTRFNQTAFKSKHPDLFERYYNQKVQTKESMMVRWKIDLTDKEVVKSVLETLVPPALNQSISE